ncbi:nuclear transport factor 2 family protein [Croceitalea rosinachiae]|uniref:Nuclear transport factor 2 family protein n=1 Tax=Croceitalea rosinachiae TaxID=3075596 RepID=A0ABU3ADA3_9FLAO|nr:nuclear transport factor 2 family protein [Croceitalea sp. F388]MDT0607093.1 nuclear transport factor 2 family protein [Croceitalea sp. F388]
MKKVIFALLLVPFFNAQAQTSTLEFDNAEIAQNLITEYVKALQNGDADTMNAQLSDNAMIYNLGGAPDSMNVKQHHDYYKNSIANFKHEISRDLYLPVKVTDSWNEGEWVLSWGTNTITNKNSGNQTPIPYHTASMVADGKIIAIYYFYDVMNVMENQGYKLVPPSE